MIDLLAVAHGDNGYVGSYLQVVRPEDGWTDPDNGRELCCAGHMIEAAVAFHHATGDTRLRQIAQRFADYIDPALAPGPGGTSGAKPSKPMPAVSSRD